jgi:hypothetical protein
MGAFKEITVVNITRISILDDLNLNYVNRIISSFASSRGGILRAP